MYAWGAGTLGQLGTGQWQDMHTPAAVQIAAPAWAVCGANHVVSCTGGGLLAWGQTPLALDSPGGDDMPSSSSSSSSSRLHMDDHEKQTPKQQQQQQQHPELCHAAGSSSPLAPAGCCSTPSIIALPPGTRITSAAAGWDHTLLLTGGGTVLCCGDNTWGQCGLPFDTARVTRLTPVLGIPSNITAVAAGLRHSLCLVLGAANQQQCGCCAASSGCGCDPRAPGTAGSTAAGAVGSAMVYAWGSNRHQQLGCREAPAAQTPPPSIHSVADQAQAGAACIGRNTKPKQKQAYWQPAPLQLLSGVQQISAGGDRSAAVTAAGSVLLWGRGLCGAPSSSNPVEYHLTPSNSSSSSSREEQSEQQHMPCMAQSEVGTSSQATLQQAPTVPGDSRQSTLGKTETDARGRRQPQGVVAAAQVCLGWQHVVARDCQGGVWAWGSNRAGQVETCRPILHHHHQQQRQEQQQEQQQQQPQTMYATPQHLSLPQPAVAVAAGAEHCAAALVDGSVWCWGWGEHGQLGLGAAAGTGDGDSQDVWQPELVPLPLGRGTRQVACGSGFTLAWDVCGHA